MSLTYIDQAGTDLAASQRTAQVLQGAINSYFQNKFAGDQNARAQDLFDAQMREANRQRNINEILPGELLPGQTRPASISALPVEDPSGAGSSGAGPVPTATPSLQPYGPPIPSPTNLAVQKTPVSSSSVSSWANAPVPLGEIDTTPERFKGLTPEQRVAAEEVDAATAGSQGAGGGAEGVLGPRDWEKYNDPGADVSDWTLAEQRKKFWDAHDAKMNPASAVANLVTSPAPAAAPQTPPAIIPNNQPGVVTPPTNPTISAAPSVLPDVSMPAPVAAAAAATPAALPPASPTMNPGGAQMASQLPQAVLQQLIAQGAKMGATPSETVAAINANANAMQGGQAIFHTPATAEMMMALSAKGVPPSAYLDSNGNVDFSRAAVAESQMTRMMLEVQLQKFEREGAGAGDVRAMRTSGEEAAKLGPQLNSLDGVIHTMTDPSVPDAVKLQTGYQAKSILKDMGVDTTLADKYLQGGLHMSPADRVPGQSIYGTSLSPLLAHLQSIRAEQAEKLNTLRAQVKKISEANGFGTAVSDVLGQGTPVSSGAVPARVVQNGHIYERQPDGTMKAVGAAQ